MTAVLRPTFAEHECQGERLALLRWPLPGRWRAVATAPLGGGIGPCRWVLVAQVPLDYARMDPAAHLAELAAAAGLVGRGVGLLTAADVGTVEHADDGGAEVAATVGLLHPTWAASARTAGEGVRSAPGTINIVAVVPAPLADAALVNTVVTVTEAKAQALLDAGIPGTGTASDAVCIVCRDEPVTPDGDEAPLFGGPRSVWGARLARATHRAVRDGAERWAGRWRPEPCGPGGPGAPGVPGGRGTARTR